jgi:hypothetical protein
VKTPKRIQLRRTKGWRKPDGAIVVVRPSKWGNPYRLDRGITRDEVVRRFGLDRHQFGYPSDEEVRAELAGHDLACFCPLDQPCHADVLLRIANDREA